MRLESEVFAELIESRHSPCSSLYDAHDFDQLQNFGDLLRSIAIGAIFNAGSQDFREVVVVVQIS